MENGLPPANEEERIYQRVFSAASKEPDFRLKNGFADRVMQRIVASQAAYSRREWAWFMAGLAVFVVAALVSVLLTGFRFNFTFLDPIKGLILLGIALAALFQWIDKRWIKPASQ